MRGKWFYVETISIGALPRRQSWCSSKPATCAGRGIRDRDIRRALTWVLNNHERFNIRIVNISLGGDHPTTGKFTELDELVEEAVSRRLVVVVAAGNTGHRIIVPPASAPSAITVGGLNDQNHLDPRYRRMYWSSYGRGINEVRKPDIIAPAIWLAAPMLPKTRTHNAALFFWRLAGASDRVLSKSMESKLCSNAPQQKNAEFACLRNSPCHSGIYE